MLRVWHSCMCACMQTGYCWLQLRFEASPLSFNITSLLAARKAGSICPQAARQAALGPAQESADG